MRQAHPLDQTSNMSTQMTFICFLCMGVYVLEALLTFSKHGSACTSGVCDLSLSVSRFVHQADTHTHSHTHSMTHDYSSVRTVHIEAAGFLTWCPSPTRTKHKHKAAMVIYPHETGFVACHAPSQRTFFQTLYLTFIQLIQYICELRKHSFVT